MKKLCLILMASLALVIVHDLDRANAGNDDNEGTPLSNLAGNAAVADFMGSKH